MHWIYWPSPRARSINSITDLNNLYWYYVGNHACTNEYECKSDVPMAVLLEEIRLRKNKVKSDHILHNTQFSSSLYDTLSDRALRRCLEVASEKGASSWLTTIPIAEHGFISTKAPSVMLSVFGMAWLPLIFLWSVFVVPHLQLIMQWTAREVALLFCGITSCVTLLLSSWLKYVQMLW